MPGTPHRVKTCGCGSSRHHPPALNPYGCAGIPEGLEVSRRTSVVDRLTSAEKFNRPASRAQGDV